jgi:hypothetical protein
MGLLHFLLAISILQLPVEPLITCFCVLTVLPPAFMPSSPQLTERFAAAPINEANPAY